MSLRSIFQRLIILILCFGILRSAGVAQGPPGGPPREAIDACIDKHQGDLCEHNTPHGMMKGTCGMPPQGQQLACMPEGGPPPGPPKGATPNRMLPERKFVSSSSGITEPDVRFRSLTIEDGLSNNSIETILQDRLGFMWIGTRDGLNRSDGYEFTVYKHDPENPYSLSHNHVTALFEDKQGMIWVATKGGGVNRFDPNTGLFIRYLPDPDNLNSLGGDTVFSVFQDKNGNLWFGGIPETGLNKFDPSTETFTRYFPEGVKSGGFPGAGVWEIIEDETGNLWLAAESSLLQFDPRTDQFIPYFPPREENHLGALLEDAAGNLWVAGSSGIHAFDPVAKRLIPYEQGNVETMYEDSTGMFWIGTHKGLYQFDPQAERFIHYYRHDPKDEKSLRDDHILGLYEDRGGVLWIGTENGLNLFDPHQAQFMHYQKASRSDRSLSFAGIQAMFGDASGHVWLGIGPELHQLDPETGQVMHYTFPLQKMSGPGPDSESGISVVYCDSEGLVWIGKKGGILERLDPYTGEVKGYFPLEGGSQGNFQGGPPKEITALYEDHAGVLWIGILRAGLFRFDRQTERFFAYQRPARRKDDVRSIASIHITALTSDHEGNLWIGSEDGVLSRFDPKTETFSHYRHDPNDPYSISRGRMEAIHEDQAGILWIASRDGLNRFDPKLEKFTHYTEKAGLSNSFIVGMLEDRDGNLWLSTKRGLSRINPQTETFRNYDKDDGLQGNEFSRAYWQSAAGQMFFGGTNGITAFYPDQITNNPYTPSVVLTDFQLFHESEPITDEEDEEEGSVLQKPIWETEYITLTHEQKVFSFEFAALSYADPHKNQYRYILDGFENKWNTVDSKRRSATYTSLPAGEYVFRVQGTNNDGVWSDKEVALNLTILPPWWETWWAYAGYLLAAFGAVAAYVRYRTQAQKRELERRQKELEQERVVNERLQRLDKLKDEFLANTSHELRTPLNGIVGLAESLIDGATGNLSSPTKKNLSMIVSSGKRLTNLVNDILDFSKLRQHELVLQKKPIDMRVVADVVLTLSRPLIGHKDLKLLNEIPPDLPAVMADKNRVQQIMHNLVGNALKFTENGRVTVSAEAIQSKGGAAITVSDTGIGIPADRQQQIFESFEQADGATAREYGGTGLGLSVTKQLVKLHGGEIWVESSVGNGSSFTFTLPISKQAAEMQAVEEQVPTIDLRNEEKEPDEVGTTRTLSLEGRFNILIVDDEPINLQVLTNHLSLQNYHVVQALNGPEAFALIEEFRENNQQFDLIILDIMMPKISGYEVSRRLRKIYPPYELPIVMLTAKNQINDLVTGFNSGANDYLTKPFSKEELLTRIKTHLQLSKTNISYSRFVPHEYLKFLNKDNIIEVNLGDHVAKEMAVMFSDIRSFTTISENMTSQENFNFVNAYLRRVSPIIRDNNGFIVKFLGDGMMAVFPNGVDDAMRAGVTKLKQVEHYNLHRKQDGWRPINVGIGIHIGHMMVGMVGEANRMQGDAFSDNVNLTSRLEGLTKYYGSSFIISGETRNHLSDPDQYHVRFLDRVIVKGHTEPIEVYEVLDGDSEDVRRLKMNTLSLFTKGIEYYQRRQFTEAGKYFYEVLKVHPDDKAAKLYAKRVNDLLTDGVSDDWDGVTWMTSK